MSNVGGYICLYRQITQWEWYQNPNTFRVFLHCLLMANFTDGRFEGREIKRGQFVTSLDHLSKDTKLSVKEIRTALDHLQRTGELASESCNRYRVITVVKYDEYQLEGKQNGKQRASEGQAEGKQGASKGQQYKNDNKDKNIDVVDTNILNLSSGEVAEAIRRDQEIEEAAMRVGLTVTEASIQRARDLSFRYGQDQLIDAIAAAVDVPKWSYVEGILRNNRNAEKETAIEMEEHRKDHDDMIKQVLINRGEWDEEYQCSREKAEKYRRKGLTPGEAAAEMLRERETREQWFNRFAQGKEAQKA